jgi:phosphoribosylaminoimidazole-succinocarboxamide synthase
MTVSSTSEPPTLIQSGKVRELYDAGADRLLMVASDRISAFDVIMAEPIPDKGRVLTAMTAYWLDELSDLAPNHLISADTAAFPEGAAALPGGLAGLAGRSMLVHRAEMLDIECIVRGYLAGSAYKEYEREGTVHGMAMPSGLRHADRLPEPIFTPSTKATEGHDLNIGMAEAIDLVGKEAAEAASELCLAAYRRAATRAEEQGIVICDTQFELGFIDDSGRPTTAPRGPTRPPSTSNRCAIGSRTSPGTSSHRHRPCPTGSSRPPPTATSTPTNGSAAAG